MGGEEIESTVERGEEEEQGSESDSRISESRINLLKEEAEMRLEDQKETLDILRSQSSRLETIKLGLLAGILLFGLSNGVEVPTPGIAGWMVSVIWFIITAVIIVTSNIYARNVTSLFKPFILNQNDRTDNYLTDDELVSELLETTSNYSNESLGDIERRAERIINNEKRIQEFEHQLRYSHLILFFILTALLVIGLPNIPLLDLFIFII